MTEYIFSVSVPPEIKVLSENADTALNEVNQQILKSVVVKFVGFKKL